MAAGAYIVERAGGKVSDFEGEDNWLFGGEIIASNPLIFEEMRQSLHCHLSKPQGIISTLKARRKKR